MKAGLVVRGFRVAERSKEMKLGYPDSVGQGWLSWH